VAALEAAGCGARGLPTPPNDRNDDERIKVLETRIGARWRPLVNLRLPGEDALVPPLRVSPNLRRALERVAYETPRLDDGLG